MRDNCATNDRDFVFESTAFCHFRLCLTHADILWGKPGKLHKPSCPALSRMTCDCLMRFLMAFSTVLGDPAASSLKAEE